jgi:hypothetical protein
MNMRDIPIPFSALSTLPFLWFEFEFGTSNSVHVSISVSVSVSAPQTFPTFADSQLHHE